MKKLSDARYNLVMKRADGKFEKSAIGEFVPIDTLFSVSKEYRNSIKNSFDDETADKILILFDEIFNF